MVSVGSPPHGGGQMMASSKRDDVEKLNEEFKPELYRQRLGKLYSLVEEKGRKDEQEIAEEKSLREWLKKHWDTYNQYCQIERNKW